MDQNSKRKSFKEYLITSIISFVIGVGIFLLVYFIRGKGLVGASDGCLLSAAILISACGLIYVTREGFFDIFAYGFKQLGSMIFSKKANANNDFPGYKEEKRIFRQNKTRYYLFIGLVGLVFVTAFIIIKIILSKYI